MIITQGASVQMTIKKLMGLLLSVIITSQLVCAAETDYRMAYTNMDWWNKYNDEKLVGYIQELVMNNQDLKIANIRTQEAQEAVKMAVANQLPYIGFEGTAQRTFHSSDNEYGSMMIPSYKQSQFIMPLSASYEIDIWGKNLNNKRSVKKSLAMVKENERAAYISTISNFAADYFNLIKTKKLISNYEKMLEIQTEIAEMTETKYTWGLCSYTEVLSEKQSLSQLKNHLNNLKEFEDLLENQMVVILGSRTPSKIQVSDWEDVATFEIPSELNGALIQYRPDYQKMQLNVEKRGYDLKAARASLLPTFTIFGSIGYNAYQTGKMFTPSTFMSSAGITPNIDLFTGGAKMAFFRISKLGLKEALQEYEKVVLTSMQEINDSLTSAKLMRDNYTNGTDIFKNQKHKFELASQKFDIGAMSRLDYLKHEKEMLKVEEEEISSKRQLLSFTTRRISAKYPSEVVNKAGENFPGHRGPGQLVVYFSAQGHTESVAEQIAANLNADLFEIVPVSEYTSDDLDWTDDNSRVSREHEDESLRNIELETTSVSNWDTYDTVLIGYPIWWGIAAWPVNTFVEANDFTGKTVIPFCTSSSSGLGESGELLAELANSGNWQAGHRFSSNPSDSDIKTWTDILR